MAFKVFRLATDASQVKALFKRAQKRAKALGRVGVAVAVLASPLTFAESSSAALTSPTWTVMDPRTNIAGNRYDYGFTTATTGTVTRVTGTVPVGTTGSNRYVALPGIDSNYAKTASSASNVIAGDFDSRIKLSRGTWTPATQVILSGMDGDYRLRLNTNGTLAFNWLDSNATSFNFTSTVPVPFAAGTAGWIRTTLQTDATNHIVNFYTSTDGTTWTLLGTTLTLAGTSPGRGLQASYGIGADGGGSGGSSGKFYFNDIRNAITGTTTSPSSCFAASVLNCFDPNNDAVAGTSWASASVTGETWTVGRSGTNMPADIASDLSVMNNVGLPTGGTAQLREIDAVASYLLPVATSIAGGTVVKLGLAGMTNTYTPGSYTTAFRTLDGASNTLDISAATSAVAINAPTITTASATAPVYTTPRNGLSADVNPNAISVAGNYIYEADTYANTVVRMDTSTGNALTVAGTGLLGFLNTSNALTLLMNAPAGVAGDSSGNFYVSDSNNVIRKITSAGVASVVAGGGANASANYSGAGTGALLSSPKGMSLDSSGNLYFADSGSNIIRKLDTSNNLTTVVGNGTAGFVDNTAALSAQLNKPYDVFITTTGDLYIADYGNNRIRLVTGGNISTIGGGGGSYADGGPATATSMSGPQGVTVDSSGNIYVSDTNNYKVRKISSGTITLFAGSGATVVDGGSPTATLVRGPVGVRVDSSGNVLIADSNNSRVRKVSGGVITTILGTGNSSFTGDGGNIAYARFNQPRGLTVDPSGNLYVSDLNNSRVRKVDQWGTVSTVAGNGSASLSGDGGQATSAAMNMVGDQVFDSAGNMYIADVNNGRIRKVTTSGVISSFLIASGLTESLGVDPTSTYIYYGLSSTCEVWKYPLAGGSSTKVAGTGTCGFNVSGAADPTSVQLNIPRGLAFGPGGDFFVTDFGNSRIRRIDAATNALTTVAGGGASTADNVPAITETLGNISGSVVFDGIGGIYIASVLGNISRFTVGGTITRIAGTSVVAGSSGDGAGATSAVITVPRKVAIWQGALYISAGNSQTLRKIADVVPTAPLVNADAMSVPMNTPRSYPILSNDWSRSAEMDPSSVTITTAPTNGTVTLVTPTTEASTLQAKYTPNAGYTGSDSFTYRACDTTKVLCASATVSITVSSSDFTTVAGGPAEGYATAIGMSPTDSARYKNYIFIADTNQNVIRRFDTYSGQLVNVAGTGISNTPLVNVPSTSSPIKNARGITVAPDGTIAFVDYGANLIRQISTAGVVTTIAGSGSGATSGDGSAATAAGITSAVNLTYAYDGSIYFQNNNSIRRFVVGANITTIAGTAGTAGSSGDGGAATAALLNSPHGIVSTSNGDWYVADTANNKIRKITAAGVISTYAGTGTASLSGDGAAATAATLNAPRVIDIDASGNMFIADQGNARIRKITVATGFISTVAGGGASLNDNVAATSTSATSPSTVVAGNNGDYWYGDTSSLRFRYVNSSAIVNTVGSLLGGFYSGDNFNALQSQMNLVNGDLPMVIDNSGNIYIAEIGSQRIRRVDASTGVMTTVVGNGGAGNSQTAISGPQQLSFDTSGNLVFAEYNNCQVRRRNSDGSLTTLAGNGTCTTTPTIGGSPTATGLGSIWGAYAAPNGDLYIADNNSYIYRVRANIITIFAGNGLVAFSGDGGLATSASINGPRTISADSAGNVYFAEFGSNRIRMVDTAGYISTVVGNGASGIAGDGGRATSAQLCGIRSFGIDATNNLFISDGCSYKVRKVDHSTGIISSVTGTGTSAYSDNVALGSATIQSKSGMAVYGSDVYFADITNSAIRKVAGVASAGTNALASAKWTAVPPATGHANLRDSFVVTASTTSTVSKLTAVMPTSFAATPSIVSAYGLSGTVTGSVSGTTLTLSFPAQTITAGVPIGIAFEGMTNGGSNGIWNSYVTAYDSAGTTAVGWANTNVVNITASGAPATGAAGFGSVWQKSLSTAAGAFATNAVNPSGASDSTSAFTLTNSGNVNANTATLSATTMTVGAQAISSITADSTTSLASASFANNRWGLQFVTSSGANATAGSGFYSGLTSATIASGAGATNVLTATARAKVDYLQPAGTYKSTLTWRFTGGI